MPVIPAQSRSSKENGGMAAFLSRLLTPGERSRAEAILREMNPGVVIVDYMSQDHVLRVIATSEILTDNSPSPNITAVTPLCLKQMQEKKMNPFDLERNQPLMNLFLWGKTISIIFFDDETTARLSLMVERMGGTVKKDEKSDYIIAPKPIEIEGAIVVQACWVNALFGAKVYIDHKEFTFQKIERQFPATQASAGIRPSRSISVSCSQKSNTRPKSSPRVADSKQTCLSFATIGDSNPCSQTKETGRVRRSASRSKPSLKLSPMRSNAKSIVDFFSSSQSTPTIVGDSSSSDDDDGPITALPGELVIEEKRVPKESSIPKRSSSLQKNVDRFFNSHRERQKTKKAQNPEKAEAELPKPAQILRRVTDMSVTIIDDIIDSDISSEEDEGLKTAIRGVASPATMKLGSLCSALMNVRPNKIALEPSSDDKLFSDLTSFSQVANEVENDRFDVEYERTQMVRSFDDGGLEKDPLFNFHS